MLFKTTISITVCFLIHPFAHAFSGIVVNVSDGDTITVLHNSVMKKIRLYGIDCPEKRQPYGNAAKRYVEKMVLNKKVYVKPVSVDKYKRIVAWVNIKKLSLNKSILAAGLAWYYKKYSNVASLAKLEMAARKKKIGLWSNKKAIAPWRWRKENST